MCVYVCVCVCCVVKLLDFSLKRESCNLLLLSFEFPDSISKLHKPIVRCQCPLTVAVMILYANVVGHSWSFTKKKSRRVICNWECEIVYKLDSNVLGKVSGFSRKLIALCN